MEIMISFMLFLMFIFVIYFYFIQIENNSEYEFKLMESIKLKIEQMIESEVVVESILLNQTYTGCVKINKTTSEFNYVRVFNEFGESVESEIESEEAQFFVENQGRFFKLIYTNDVNLADDLDGCLHLNRSEGYQEGLVRKQKYIFETKINELLNTYENDYDFLKNEMGISSDREFGIGFQDYQGNLIEIGSSGKEETRVDELNIIYLDEQGQNREGVIYIKIWKV